MLKSYFGAGKYVILDSAVGVLEALVELKQQGIYSCALIKKRCFWPSGVPGNAIDDHMAVKEVGEIDAIQGTEGAVTYKLWAMKN